VLFTFPSRYSCAIGHRGVLRLGGWSPHLRTGFHGPRPTQGSHRALPVRGRHPLWPAVPGGSGSLDATTGLIRVRSPLLAESRLVSFPPATEMFQFAGFASRAYGFSARYRIRGGLPHSDIRGSTIARISPRLIAACYVLHRLSVPRHPPNALKTLDLSFAKPRADISPPAAREDTRPCDPQPKPQGPDRGSRSVLRPLHHVNEPANPPRPSPRKTGQTSPLSLRSKTQTPPAASARRQPLSEYLNKRDRPPQEPQKPAASAPLLDKRDRPPQEWWR